MLYICISYVINIKGISIADTVHVGSTRLMNIDGFPLLFASNQSILYNKDDTVMPYLVQRMYATNLKVDVFPDRQLVNFAVDTSISPGICLQY